MVAFAGSIVLLACGAPDLGAGSPRATVDSGGTYRETLVLARQVGRWHVVLGAHPNPAKSPTSTTRPS